MNKEMEDAWNTREEKQKVTKVDRLVWRINALWEVAEQNYFNDVELNFLTGMHEWVEESRSDTISQKQEAWIFRMFHDLYMRGKVKIPPGAF